MGPYLFANAALTGFFLFGAIYHFILWLRARQNGTSSCSSRRVASSASSQSSQFAT